MSALSQTRIFDTGAWIFMGLLLAVGTLVPLLNLLLPPDSLFHVPTYLVTLFGKYICYALLALSIDLIWGYCGILSLGHGAFFALGGYAMGMYLMRQIGTRGVYAHPELPDFMVFLNWPELPVYWYGFQSFPYALLMVVLVPGVLAFVFGWFAFRSRVTGVYLSIITQAMTFALMLSFFRNNFGFGGNNGLTDFKDILGFNIQSQGTRAALFAASCGALGLGFVICRALVTSKFGKMLVAIRDAEPRTRFLGYRAESYKLFAFTLSACMAGVAGALYVPQVGIINPGEFSPANSIEAVIWVAVGGRGTLTGAVLGALVVNYGKSVFTSGLAVPYWVFGAVALVALGWLIAIRRSVFLGAIVGAVAAGIVTLIVGSSWGAALSASSPGMAFAAANAAFLVAIVCMVVAIMREWDVNAIGALLGALMVGTFVTSYETVALAPYWLFALGGLFIAVTLLLPLGIVGTLQHHLANRRRAPRSEAPEAAMPIPRPAK
jgi:urea transport system permease protein